MEVDQLYSAKMSTQHHTIHKMSLSIFYVEPSQVNHANKSMNCEGVRKGHLLLQVMLQGLLSVLEAMK